jgi:hypothetical protein
VVTLFLAREEAQRAADAGALAAARVISVSGLTGTAGPDSGVIPWTTICGGSGSVASVMAQAVAQQNSVAGSAATVTVTYSSGTPPPPPVASCTAVTGDDLLGVNPLVTVKVERDTMPTLFSRIWSRGAKSVSATATAEAFNPSNSGKFAGGGQVVPVTPRCVKPWIIPNQDPGNGGLLVDNRRTGAIKNEGIWSGKGTGTVGEGFTLTDSCSGSDCSNMAGKTPAPGAYIPALVSGVATAVPSCADDSNYQKAIGGCDQSTVYACGTVNGSNADLTINPGLAGGDTSVATQCLIHQSGGAGGQDAQNVGAPFPYPITAGSANPVVSANQLITASNSIVTLPIYDDSVGTLAGTQPAITIVGFLQVFIDSVDAAGNLQVHVVNISGCGNDASTTLSAPGSSPVPIRLITPQ